MIVTVALRSVLVLGTPLSIFAHCILFRACWPVLIAVVRALRSDVIVAKRKLISLRKTGFPV